MKTPFRKKPKTALRVEQKIKRRTFLSFAAFTALYGLAYTSWRWLYTSPVEVKKITGGARKPLRRALNKTELAFRRLFSSNHPVKTFPRSMAAVHVRKNGNLGLKTHIDSAHWELEVKSTRGKALYISLDQLKALPKTEIIFDFKCVEGWDQISHWGGVKFIDFVNHFHLDKEAGMNYVGLQTPDKQYYVGLDMASALHPQTILSYEMNGNPLLPEHGAPLRLIIPVKYGIKNLKRIGSLKFSNTRPPDYWAERGYDYYSGL